LLNSEELKKIEPNIDGLGAIFLKTTGIVNYRDICLRMEEEFRLSGGKTELNAEVTSLHEDTEKVIVRTNLNKFEAKVIVNCTGLMTDRLVKMLNIKTDFQIIPFRGEYYQLPAKKNNIVSHLIYPIPDPNMPFLGIHLTRMIDGSVTVGPNAVQGWKREGYGRFNFSLRDVWEMILFPGFWKMIYINFNAGIIEMKNSLWKRAYLRQVQKYCPTLKISDLKQYPVGIRAQAVFRDGTLADDFLFAQSRRSLHVCNAPSPAATSAIPIGAYICKKLVEEINK
jgi:(S)-2-hydroxyglutarate dehydrogenase